MHRGSFGLISVPVFLVLLGVMLPAGVPAAGITLVEPAVTVTEGDRVVDLEWSDPLPTDLVSIGKPRLGTPQYPWRGKAALETGGFYQGACDWTYSVSLAFHPDSTTLKWDEITDWVTASTRKRHLRLRETDRPYNFSNGITISVPSAGLFRPSFAGWTGALPSFGGIYRGGVATDTAVVFQLVCASGGEIGAQAGIEVRLDWTNGLGQSGTIAATRADSTVDVSYGFKLAFAAGTYVQGQAFSVEVAVPFGRPVADQGIPADVFKIDAYTFEGYLVLRRSVEDGFSASGDTLYKVIADLSRCEHPEFFANAEGEQDPYGTRRFTDKGMRPGSLGVTPDTSAFVVLNGFPYKYAVLTYDWSADHNLVTSDTTWTLVYPSPSTAGKAASGVRVVPNPYTFHSGWEEGEAKIQFVNVPLGAVIRIYDASGGYIRTVRPNMDHLQENQAATADWNLIDSDGEQVVSGIYIFRVEAGGSSAMGRFIVIR